MKCFQKNLKPLMGFVKYNNYPFSVINLFNNTVKYPIMYKHIFHYIIKRREKGGNMISYAPLWETMKDRGITTYMLINTFGFDSHTLNDLKHHKSGATK